MTIRISLALATILFAAPSFAQQWRTCNGPRCSQEQATFATLNSCRLMESHRSWAKCFPVNGGISQNFRSCVYSKCSQEQATFPNIEECVEYVDYREGKWGACFDPAFPP